VANTSRRSAVPYRKISAGVLASVALFVVFFGAGMMSWAIVACGVALLVLAISPAAVNVVRRGARAWVPGTAHVVSASEPPASSTYGRCELQIVVAAPNLPAAAVKVRDPRVPVAKWPDAGSTLPVMVAADDMRHVRIQWDEVMTHSEAATVLHDVPVEYGDPSVGDDMLVGQDSPEWSTPAPDRPWAPAPGAGGGLGQTQEGPVIVQDAPGGPVVLEGTLVDDAQQRTAPHPRRPRPSPYPRPEAAPEDAAPSPPAAGGRPGGDEPDPSGDSGPPPSENR